MKKLLIACITVALMTGAWAVEQSQTAFNLTQESFEDMTADATLDVSDERTDTQWVCEDSDATLKAVAYTDEDKAYTYGTPADNTRATAWSTQNNYLSIDTGSQKPLWRTLAMDGETAQSVADAGYVIDTLVQFTGTDTAPTPMTEKTEQGDESIIDKFVLWLESTTNEENDEQVNTLKVICGQSDGTGMLISGEPLEIALDKSVTPGEWARVSVKAIALDTMGDMGFVVFIDGKAVSATEDEYDKIGSFDYLCDGEAEGRFNARQLFPCISPNVAEITKVGFEGSGKIDDVQILAEADEPEFMKYAEEEPGTETVTVSFQAVGLEGSDTWTADDKEVTVGEVIAEMPSTELTGYTFNGWYTTSTCLAGDEFATDTLIEKEMTIYAKFTKNVVSYTVTFAQKGLPEGTDWTAPDELTIESGKTIGDAIPTIPEVTGYTATGWFTDENCSVAFADGAITQATILYAKYEVVETDPDPIAPGATASFTDKTKADTWAANKDNIVTPDVLKNADATVIAKYKSYLVGSVTGDDTEGYTVTFDIDETQKETIESELATLLPTVLSDSETKSFTGAVPGLYYTIEACDTVTGTYAVGDWDWAQADADGNVALTITKDTNKTAEFYRIKVQAVDPNEAK